MEIFSKRNLAQIFGFAVLAFVVMGYHPAVEDDNLYLSAVTARLHPELLQKNAEFFTSQLKTSTFDTWMAAFIRVSHIPIAWSELLWQFVAIFLILAAAWAVVCRLFEDSAARWGGIAMLAAMFTLPVSGTALYLVDQYLHPRNLASALILWGIARLMAGKRWQAVPFLVVAFVLHPLMGAFGISFCCILAVATLQPVQARIRALREQRLAPASTTAAMVIPFGWIFGPPSAPWLEALKTRHLYFLYQWEWYEWLGVIGPMIIFWAMARHARKQKNPELASFSYALLVYSAFQLIISMAILSPWAPVGFTTLEPMRYLHLVYVFLALIGGAYIGRYVLKSYVWRWAVFLILANGGMFFAQRQLFASTPHIELPNATPSNPWLQAFAWIRDNTPPDAFFALDPNYQLEPDEDYHSFRGLAQRGSLADAYKDTATVTKEPNLGPDWKAQLAAQQGWKHFTVDDFKRLRAQFGVDWVLVSFPAPQGLDCHWHNQRLAACQIP